MTGEVYINGSNIGEPSSFTPEEIDITRGERFSDGTLNFDVIATKHKWSLSFEFMTAAEMATLMTATGTKQFVNFQFTENGTLKTYVVWCNPVARDVLYLVPETWQNVKVVLDER